MWQRLFPKQMDNHYRGQTAALWIFFALAFLHTGISLVAIFRPDGGAQSADGIPLDTFGAAGAQAVIGVVAFLGLADLWLALACWLAAIRYRSAVPLLYGVLVLDWLLHKGIGAMKPIPRVEHASAPGGFVSIGLLVLSAVGLALSLWERPAPRLRSGVAA